MGKLEKQEVRLHWLRSTSVVMLPCWLLRGHCLLTVCGNKLPAFAKEIMIHEPDYFSFSLLLELFSVR